MTKLTDYQSELIQKYYDRVYKSVYRYIGRFTVITNFYGGRAEATDAAIGYIVESAMSFDINKAEKESKFVTWASIKCIHNILDNHRFVLNKSSTSQKRSLYNKIKHRMLSETGHIDYQKIFNKIKQEHGIKVTAREVFPERDIYEFSEYLIDDNNFLEGIQWDDLKRHLIERANKMFGQKYPLYTAVLEQYLIPKCENAEYPTLKTLSEKLNCSEVMLCNIITSDLMKDMIESCETSLLKE